jgi:cell division protein FtsB
MSKDKDKKSNFPRLWLFVLLVLGALVLGDLNQRMADARRLDQDTALLEDDCERLEEENTSLEAEIAVANTEEYVENWAHQKARLVREGEVIVILLNSEGEEIISSIQAESDDRFRSNWDEWMELIFGK